MSEREQTKNSGDNWALMMSATKQYYQLGLSQDVIAKNLYVSKSTVSRLIKKAIDMGYIEFHINDFGETDEVLQHEFMETFDVRCIILPTYVDSLAVRLNDVCAFAAKEIFPNVQDNEIICVPWGKTFEYLAANINEPLERENIKICMLNGFVTGSIRSMKAIHIVEKLSKMLNASGYLLPCPLLVDSAEVKNILLQDRNVSQVVDLLQEAQTTIFSVGPFDMQHTYLTELGKDVTDHLRSFNGAGNLTGRTYDINGSELPTNLYHRLMSMPIKELVKKEKRICIAVGEYKARAILGLLRGKITNLLYTDTETARAVLREHKKMVPRARNWGR